VAVGVGPEYGYCQLMAQKAASCWTKAATCSIVLFSAAAALNLVILFTTKNIIYHQKTKP
jgi:hypothetical protein